MTSIRYCQTEVITKVHQLVLSIINHDLDLDSIKDELNNLYQAFMYHYEASDQLIYSKPINIFFSGTQSIVGDRYPDEIIWDHHNVNQLINLMKHYKSDIDHERRAWIYQERQNQTALNKYITDLTTHYARLLFVRVDFKYAQAHSHLITVDDFNEHINKLCQLMANKKTCFKHLEGYAWALEQGGIEGGLHCHLLLMYDGAKRQNDWYIAKEVGEKWLQITEGFGAYYNYHESNNKQRYQQYDRLGIGMIHRDNNLEIENARRTALYLTKPEKTDQYLKAWIPNMRTFGHGQYRISKRRMLPPISK